MLLYDFRSFFEDLRALQYLNISNNVLMNLGEDECNFSKKSLAIIDLSDNNLDDQIFLTKSSSFFVYLGSKELYLKGNKFRRFISKFYKLGNYDKSEMKILDLRYNELESLEVSVKFENCNF